MKKKLVLSLASLVLVMSSYAYALTAFNPTDLSGLSQDAVYSLIQTVAIGFDHHALMPASPMGIFLGVDVGIEASAISLPSDFVNAMALASGSSASSISNYLPILKLNVHKGLPFGIDVGASYITLSDQGTTYATSYGADVKWAFKSGSGTALAVRGGVSSNTIYFLHTNTYSADVLASRSFLYLLEPYVGAGLQYWAGSINVPVNIPGLPSSVSAGASNVNPRVFAGGVFKFLVAAATVEVDQSLAGITTYVAKISVSL